MGMERSAASPADTPNPTAMPDTGGAAAETAWEGAEAAATGAAAAGGAAAVGMAKGWQPPTSEPGMGMDLANDVPAELDAASDTAELSIDEQVRYFSLAKIFRCP